MQEPTSRYLRARDIYRDPKTERDSLLPISRSTWWAWVQSGRAPAPIHLSPGVTVWDRDAVLRMAEQQPEETAN